jgi:hypothetical protein
MTLNKRSSFLPWRSALSATLVAQEFREPSAVTRAICTGGDCECPPSPASSHWRNRDVYASGYYVIPFLALALIESSQRPPGSAFYQRMCG